MQAIRVPHRVSRQGLGILAVLTTLLMAGCASNPPAPTNTPTDSTSSERALMDLPEARKEVVFTAHAMLGRPYRYGGHDPGHGFDCSGLVNYAYDQAGISVPRTTHAQYSTIRPVAPTALKPGDLVFFNIGSKPSHVGIYVGNGQFIHAPSSGKRVSKSSLSEPYWKRRLTRSGSYF